MKFSYARFSETVQRPVIPIVLLYGDQSVTYEVLVDSGADMNIFDLELAEELGIDVTSGVAAEVVSATGDAKEIYIHALRLRVDDHEFETRAAFMAEPSQDYGLAGQRGFFDQFIVQFDYAARELELTVAEP
jgi:hypothetical protein